jgi:hypothetical protein
MLIELCVGNYATFDDLVNGKDDILKNYTRTYSKSYMWIDFQNLQIWVNIRIEYAQLYEFFEIQIGSNPFDVITRIQFPIHLIARCTIHCA